MTHRTKIVPLLIALATLSLTCCAGAQENPEEQDKSTKYTITFIQNGQNNIVKEVAGGATLTDIPTPVGKTGYNVSWDRTVFENITTDITVNAVEIAKTYTLSYDLGLLAEDKYASITSATQMVFYDASYSLYVPECYGYIFVKWAERESGNEFVDGIWHNDRDVFLTAVWESNNIKVCFSDTPRNATQSDLKVVLPEEYKEPIRVEYGDTIKGGLPKGEPLNKDDYKFDKWVTYIDGKEVTITDATVFGKSDFSGIQGGEIIIYPVLKNLWVGPF